MEETKSGSGKSSQANSETSQGTHPSVSAILLSFPANARKRREGILSMKYSNVIIASLILAMTSATAFSQEFAGDWVSVVDPITKTTAKTVYEFNVDGSKLTGSVLRGLTQEEIPIVNGKIKGDKISFTVQMHYEKFTADYLFEGKISGDTIDFNATYGLHTRLNFTVRKTNQ
jgi:hypothetical protein